MDLQTLLTNPRINIFDIIPLERNNYIVVTFQKPGESQYDYSIRHQKNIATATRLKHKKPAF